MHIILIKSIGHDDANFDSFTFLKFLKVSLNIEKSVMFVVDLFIFCFIY